METLRICRQCQQPLPENAPEGLCPACLAKVALGSEPAAPGATINVNPLAEAAPDSRVPPSVAELAPQFPQLEILELLGMGGMGMVYKARQPRVDRLVALKILPVDSARGASFAERFQREAKALAKLNHPGIVTFYDFGQTGQYYYFIMEYVDGMNLRKLLHAQPLEPRQALELVTQICTALQFAHDEGVVHRDIKPENILLNKKGQVKIADFGLAKLLGAAPDTALTMSQAAMGTLNYMAPEQRENAQKVDHRADIYSLGVVFYEMLTGEVPMGRFDPPSKRVQVDVRLDEVVLHALEREPARRYQHVGEVKTSVETIASTMPRERKATGAPETLKPQATPGFASYVLKRSAILVLAWLGAVLCRDWAVGDASFAVGGNEIISVRGLVISICGLLDLGWVFVPLGVATIIHTWLEAREKRGLSLGELPPQIRRRLSLCHAVMLGGYLAALLATIWAESAVYKTRITALLPDPLEKTREWWFVPASGGYEKLGLRANFASIEQNGKVYYQAPLACTVSLIVHRKDTEPAVMNVALPGLRAEYRIPATNPWPATSVLDKDTLVVWLHNGAGLNPAAPKFQEQVGEIYELLKQYENAPPHTAEEFANTARADLRDFRDGGFAGGGMADFGSVGINWLRVLVLFLSESLLYMAASSWATRRLYRAAWIEIAAGRWTPPKATPKRFPLAIKALFALVLITLPIGVVGLRGDPLSILLLVLSLGTILVVVLQLHSRQQIQQARAKGLWPQLGEPPTLEHVKRLAQAGENILAFKLYRQIHGGSLADAKAAVEKLAG